jgi:hypothetical protein
VEVESTQIETNNSWDGFLNTFEKCNFVLVTLEFS